MQQLTFRADRRTPHGRFGLDASYVCLVGGKPAVLRPVLFEARGSMTQILRPDMMMSNPPLPITTPRVCKLLLSPTAIYVMSAQRLEV